MTASHLFYGFVLLSVVLFIGVFIIPHFSYSSALSSGSTLYVLVLLNFAVSIISLIIGVTLVRRGITMYIGCAIEIGILAALIYSMTLLARIH